MYDEYGWVVYFGLGFPEVLRHLLRARLTSHASGALERTDALLAHVELLFLLLVEIALLLGLRLQRLIFLLEHSVLLHQGLILSFVILTIHTSDTLIMLFVCSSSSSRVDSDSSYFYCSDSAYSLICCSICNSYAQLHYSYVLPDLVLVLLHLLLQGLVVLAGAHQAIVVS